MEIRFIEVAGNHNCRGDCIKHTEDPDSYHKLFKFVSFRSCADPTLLLYNGAYSEERYKTSQEESRTNDEIYKVGSKNKISEMLNRGVAYVANASQRIAVN